MNSSGGKILLRECKQDIMTKTIAIVQARVGSKRLPGKILMRLAEKSIVEHTLSALQQCHNVDAIYLATGSGPENYPLKEISQRLGVNIFLGSEDDVLQRFWDVVEQEKKAGNVYDNIVRICADSPFIDTEEVDRLIEAHEQHHADLSINYNHPTGLPCGFGVEVISFDALKESVELAEKDEHHEHLDEWILQHPQKYCIYQHPVAKEKQSYRIYFTIDTPDDFVFMEGVVNEVLEKKRTFKPLDLLNAVRQKPQLLSPRKMKLFVRADGNGEIGMGHIMRSLTVCAALKESIPKLEVTYYTTAPALEIVRKNKFDVALFQESTMQHEIIDKNPDFIIIDLRKHLDDLSSRPLNRALKVRFIDSEIAREIRGDLIINSFPLPQWLHQNYYSGLQYLPLRQEFSQLPPKQLRKEVKKITIALGGGDQLGEEKPGALILKLLSVLQDFPLQVTIILGSAMNREAVEKIKRYSSPRSNIHILHDAENIPTLFYETDIGISAGGNTILEFARCEVPTISISLDYDTTHKDHQQYYCKAMEEAGASIYLGHADDWDPQRLREMLKELINNSSRRREMATRGRALIDDHIREKISMLILNAYTQG